MRGDLIRWILEDLTPSPKPIGGILGAFFDYGKRGYSEKEVGVIDKNREVRDADLSEKEKHRVRVALSKLKSDGCLELVDQKWKVTETGLRKVYELRQKTVSRIPGTKYEKVRSKSTVLVMFDIPEGQRGKRIWLRSVLINLGLTMLQRSVWAGKIKLPKELIEDMHRLGISDYIQIISLDKFERA